MATDADGWDFAGALRERRRELGLSIRGAAKLSGLSPGHWCDLEHGVHGARAGTIEDICRALRCGPEKILGQCPGQIEAEELIS